MEVLTKAIIFEILKYHKTELKHHHVKRLGLFGSILKGTNSERSDVDLLVEFEEGKKNYDNFIEVAFLLEDILKTKVDLLTIDALSPYMKPKILKEAYFESI